VQKITEARRVGAPRWSSEPRSGELTTRLEMRSNFVKNVHQKRNRVGSGGSAGCARLRRQRCKGKIQIFREPPEKRMKKNAKISLS